MERASGSLRYEEASGGEILRRKREGNGDLGDRKMPSRKRAGGSLRDEEARCGDILRKNKERERDK